MSKDVFIPHELLDLLGDIKGCYSLLHCWIDLCQLSDDEGVIRIGIDGLKSRWGMNSYHSAKARLSALRAAGLIDISDARGVKIIRINDARAVAASNAQIIVPAIADTNARANADTIVSAKREQSCNANENEEIPNAVEVVKVDADAIASAIVSANAGAIVATNADAVVSAKKPKKQKSEPFVKPTIEEVAAYIREKGYNVDAEQFVAFYESNGWRVGKNPMRNWKMALITWHKKHQSYGNGNNFGDARQDERQYLKHGETTAEFQARIMRQLAQCDPNDKDGSGGKPLPF